MLNDRIKIYKAFFKRKMLDVSRGMGRLYTPMDMVILNLKIRGYIYKHLTGLDLFVKHGLWVSNDYASQCDSLECWEIDSLYGKFAERNIPCHNLMLRIGDSIKAVQNNKLSRNKYSFIVIDNPIWSPYGGKYYEYFDLFPSIFKYVGEECIIVVNILLDMESHAKSIGEKEISGEWIDRRKDFYGVDNKKDVILLDIKDAMRKHRELSDESNVNLNDVFYVPRSEKVAFLIMCFKS